MEYGYITESDLNRWGVTMEAMNGLASVGVIRPEDLTENGIPDQIFGEIVNLLAGSFVALRHAVIAANEAQEEMAAVLESAEVVEGEAVNG